MNGPTFLMAAAIACGTVLMIVKTIAGAITRQNASSSEFTQLRDQFDHCAAVLDETQATLAAQSAQLAELQERVDFAERVMTDARNRGALGSGETGR